MLKTAALVIWREVELSTNLRNGAFKTDFLCFPHCFLPNAFSGDHPEENKHKLRAVNPGIDVSAFYTIVFPFCRQHLYCFTNGLSEVLVH